MFKYIFLGFTGFTAGVFVAAGIFSFIVMIGVLARFAARTKTIQHVMLYEDVILLGGTAGNLFYLFCWDVPFGNGMLGLYGFFSGVFVGCLALALAEALNVLPILTKRIRLRKGLKYIVLCLSLGKCAGVLLQMVF